MLPFNVIWQPRETIQHYLSKPILLMSVVMVILPPIITALFLALTGFLLDYTMLGMMIIAEIVMWVIAAAVLYVLLFLLKGWQIEGKFNALLGALSLLAVLRIVLVIVGIIAMTVISPGYWATLANISHNPNIQANDYVSQFNGLIGGSTASPVQLILFIIAIAITFYFIFFMLYVLYKIIALAKESSTAKNLLIFIIMLAVMYCMRLLVPSAFYPI